MKAILLPRNYIKFPLVTLIVSKIAYKSLQNTKIVHFLRIFYRNVDRENFFRDFAKIICIESRKFVETNQGYQSHQLLSDLDTYIRRYCSFLKMACTYTPLKKNSSWCDKNVLYWKSIGFSNNRPHCWKRWLCLRTKI